jgi:hypothetical protein
MVAVGWQTLGTWMVTFRGGRSDFNRRLSSKKGRRRIQMDVGSTWTWKSWNTEQKRLWRVGNQTSGNFMQFSDSAHSCNMVRRGCILLHTVARCTCNDWLKGRICPSWHHGAVLRLDCHDPGAQRSGGPHEVLISSPGKVSGHFRYFRLHTNLICRHWLSASFNHLLGFDFRDRCVESRQQFWMTCRRPLLRLGCLSKMLLVGAPGRLHPRRGRAERALSLGPP